MAVRFIDGFGHYASEDIGLKYQVTNGFIRSVVQPTGGPGGRPCMLHIANSGPGIAERWFSPDLGSSVIVGGRALWSAVPSVNESNGYFALYEGSTLHIELRHTTTFRLRVSRNGTALATGTTVLAANRWYYIEMKVVIHDTAGEVYVWLNGQLEISATGLDTRNGGTGVIDRVRHQMALADGSYQWRITDFYVADASDSYPLLPLNDVKVETIFPNGAGANTDFDDVGGGSTFGTNRVQTPSSGSVSTTGSVGATNPNNVLDNSLGTIAGITRTNGNKIRVAWSVSETLNMIEIITHGGLGDFKLALSNGYETPFLANPGTTVTYRWFVPEAAIDWIDVLTLENDGVVAASAVYDVRAYRATDNANWKAVDDPTITALTTSPILDADTDYVSSGTVGDKDTYAMSDLSNGVGSVHAAQVNIAHRKDDAGVRTIRRVIRSGGTDYEGADVSVSDSWLLTSEVVAENPDTSAPWTLAEMNAVEAGVKVEA